jgi:hypothetical protein
MKKTKWVHINFWFKDPYKEYLLTLEEYEEFLVFLRDLVKTNCPKRKFFLFEPYPHCFLAMEIDRKVVIDRVPDFVQRYEVKSGNDTDNGQLFLDIMDKFTDFSLSIYNKDNLAHLLHCMLNQVNASTKGSYLLR